MLSIPKLIKIKDSDKIKQKSNTHSASTTLTNALLSDSNRPKILFKASFLSLICNFKEKLSDLKLVTSSKADYNLDKEETDLFSEILAMNINVN